MTSMSDFAGQSLTWVSRGAVWQLITPDNSVIATFPLETSGSHVGIAGIRYKKAKALIPDGTGALFLNGDGPHATPLNVAIYSVEQGPRLATYIKPWLMFADGRTFLWDRVLLISALLNLRRDGLKALKRGGAGDWTLVKKIAGTNDTTRITYVGIRDGMYHHHVDISPRAAEVGDPELSLLLVLGLYNIDVENTERMLGGPDYGVPGR
jgi:hypothetical protein